MMDEMGVAGSAAESLTDYLRDQWLEAYPWLTVTEQSGYLHLWGPSRLHEEIKEMQLLGKLYLDAPSLRTVQQIAARLRQVDDTLG